MNVLLSIHSKMRELSNDEKITLLYDLVGWFAVEEDFQIKVYQYIEELKKEGKKC